MRRFTQILGITAVLMLAASLAMADTCVNFDGNTCATGSSYNGSTVHIGGTGSTGLSVGIFVGGGSFTVSTTNGKSSGEIFILLASPNSLASAKINGNSVTSSSFFPEGAATGAITDTLVGLNICATASSCNLNFAFVDSGATISGSQSVSLMYSGLPKGTAIYAVIVNDGKIVAITPNSEAGITNTTVPEPGTLALLGTGLLGLAGTFRRRLGL